MRLYGKWRVELPDGESYLWEPDEVTLGEQSMLEGEWGGSYQEWIRNVGEERATAVQVLIWFLRRKDGREQDRTSVNFPIRHLEINQVVDEVAADPEAPEPSESDTSDGPALSIA